MTPIEIFGMIVLGLGAGFSKLGLPTALVFSPLHSEDLRWIRRREKMECSLI